MTEILVHPSDLRSIADQLSSDAKKIGTALQAIDNNILSLKGDRFLGKRANAVQSHYQSKRDVLQQTKELAPHFA